VAMVESGLRRSTSASQLSSRKEEPTPQPMIASRSVPNPARDDKSEEVNPALLAAERRLKRGMSIKGNNRPVVEDPMKFTLDGWTREKPLAARRQTLPTQAASGEQGRSSVQGTPPEVQSPKSPAASSFSSLHELQKGYGSMKSEFSSLSIAVNEAVSVSRKCSRKMASIEDIVAEQVHSLQQSTQVTRSEFDEYKSNWQIQVSSQREFLEQHFLTISAEFNKLKLAGQTQSSSVSGLKEKVEYLQTEIDNLTGKQGHTAHLDSRLLEHGRVFADGLLTLEKLEAVVFETQKDILQLKRVVNNPSQHGWKSSSYPGRISPIAEPFSSILPYTRWDQITPTRGTLDELRQNPAIRELVPEIVNICGDIQSKLQEVKCDDEAMKSACEMDDNELCGILGYTHDLCQPDGQEQGNLYYELNSNLRLRDVEGRNKMMARWGVAVHYTLKGLSRLPDFEGIVLRVLPDKKTGSCRVRGRPPDHVGRLCFHHH